MSNIPHVTIVFKSGAMHTVTDLARVWVYVSRHDVNKIEYVVLDGETIEGEFIEDVAGNLMSTRVRYV